jgi:hypothetical protein
MKIAKLALLFLLFTGMAHATDFSDLPGTWYSEKATPDSRTLAAEMTLAQGGKFHGHVDINQRRMWNFAGKWKVTGNKLHYDYTESDSPAIPPGTQDEDRIIEVTPTELKLQTDSGKETWVRRRETN